MRSIILRTASKILLVITFIFSIWVLFRGHNSPGGGFIGGLIFASGFALYLLAHGVTTVRRIIKVQLSLFLALGLILALCGSLIALFQDKNFLTGIWVNIKFLNIQLGTPILFDLGIYFVVLGSVLIMMLALEEST